MMEVIYELVNMSTNKDYDMIIPAWLFGHAANKTRHLGAALVNN